MAVASGEEDLDVVDGLTATEVAARLRRDGRNELPVPRRTPAWRRLAAQMVHFFALLFWVAGVLAFVAGLPQLGVAIFFVVVLNGVFAFVQEERAEHAAERLRDLLPRRVTVVRDGQRVEIPAEDLVVGDVVLLAEGDRISADLTLESVHALAVDSSALTGESVSHHPDAGETVFAGCFVVEGEARSVVTATGSDTRLASIAELTHAQQSSPTPLHFELTRVSRVLAVIAIGVGVGFFLSVVARRHEGDGRVSVRGRRHGRGRAQKGCFPTVTLSLAIGAQRMAARQALVRHLEAVETLGSTTFIATDKTGTLTRNQMVVVEVWMPSGKVLVEGRGLQPAG